jgi:predicted Fe-Mo cluster-binding NifX family protein
MKIAIPIWDNLVSSAFDFAKKLLLVDVENQIETNRSEIPFEAESLPEKVIKLKDLGVNVLVCGAISQTLANMVEVSGIQVLPFVAGRVDDVLKAYLKNQLPQPHFTMPGYWPSSRKGFRRRRGRCRWQDEL